MSLPAPLGARAVAEAAGASVVDDPDELAAFTRWERSSGGNENANAESSLRIVGMHCAACAGTIDQTLLQQTGVVEARVSAAAQCGMVRWDDRPAAADGAASRGPWPRRIGQRQPPARGDRVRVPIGKAKAATGSACGARAPGC